VPGDVGLPIEDYAYDGEGNRLASHLSQLYVSNDHNQLSEDDSYTYAYDARGNRSSRTDKATGAVETYTYDSQNRLVGYASDTTTASYAYDALGRRIAKTVDGSVEAFVYDAWSLDPIANNVVLDFEDGILARRWLHGTRVDEQLAVEDYAGTTAPGTGSLRSLFANRLGSIAVAVSVTTGAVAAEAEYDSFGAREITVGTGAEMPRYGFTGREHDTESGLIYFRARHYDPTLGQFVQRDPIGFAAGDLNIYAYVSNDPKNLIDPSGLLQGPLPKKATVTSSVYGRSP
jgi:RHS repeat-associated protein